MMRRITGLIEIADSFDTALVDQFGVLHDGRSLYPHAREALEGLRAAGKRVALISNSGKRAAPNVERLARLGLPNTLFDAFVSSGEVAHGLLSRGEIDVPKNAQCLVVSRGDGAAPLQGLSLRPAQDATSADLVLIAGSEGERVSLDDYRAMLAPAARRGVPALCTNPDRHMLTAAGIAPGAGAIADLYAQLGGSVMRIGKPEPAIYYAAARTLGGIDWARCIGVGDSAEHDVAGIQGVGGRAVLVRTGVADQDDGENPAADCDTPTIRWK